jgi:ATP-dependent protease ClpP protease subunit
MNLKYVHNYLGSDTATMRIYNEIGGLFGVNGSDFCNEMMYLTSIGVKNINIRINSVGGSVVEGQSIMACMRELNNSGYNVNTYVDYMAASIAGVIAMYGKKRFIVSNGLFMMHDPSGGGNDAKSKEVLDLIKDTLAEQLANSSGKTIDDIKAMMSTETWMDANTAIKNGFFDEVFDSIVRVENVDTNNYVKAFEISNKLLLKTEKKMDKIVNRLSLSNEATQEEVILIIDELEGEKKALDEKKAVLESQVEDLKNKVAELEKSLTEKAESEALVLIENAIKEGKIKAEAKDIIFQNAKKDFAAVKNMLDAIPVVGANLFRNIVDKKATQGEDRSSWTFDDWRKKDGAGLIEMSKDDKEKYNNLFNNR